MRLKTVALISLTALVGKELIWLFANHAYLVHDFPRYALSSIDTWVLIFFFAMLYMNSES